MVTAERRSARAEALTGACLGYLCFHMSLQSWSLNACHAVDEEASHRHGPPWWSNGSDSTPQCRGPGYYPPVRELDATCHN